jgi:hypothetical protein
MSGDGSLSVTIAPPGATDPSQKLVITDLLPSDTVQHLKRTIAREIRQPGSWAQLTLFFGDRLENDKTLAECRIEDGDEIFIPSSISLRAPPPSELPGSTAFPTNRATPKSSSQGGWTRPDVPGPRLQNLGFKWLEGKTVMLNDVPTRATCSQVKQLLQKEKGQEIEYLRFIYAGKQLDGTMTLEDYNVQEVSVLVFGAREIKFDKMIGIYDSGCDASPWWQSHRLIVDEKENVDSNGIISLGNLLNVTPNSA